MAHERHNWKHPPPCHRAGYVGTGPKSNERQSEYKLYDYLYKSAIPVKKLIEKSDH
jgi:hypothetical protein